MRSSLPERQASSVFTWRSACSRMDTASSASTRHAVLRSQSQASPPPGARAVFRFVAVKHDRGRAAARRPRHRGQRRRGVPPRGASGRAHSARTRAPISSRHRRYFNAARSARRARRPPADRIHKLGLWRWPSAAVRGGARHRSSGVALWPLPRSRSRPSPTATPT